MGCLGAHRKPEAVLPTLNYMKINQAHQSTGSVHLRQPISLLSSLTHFCSRHLVSLSTYSPFQERSSREVGRRTSARQASSPAALSSAGRLGSRSGSPSSSSATSRFRSARWINTFRGGRLRGRLPRPRGVSMAESGHVHTMTSYRQSHRPQPRHHAPPSAVTVHRRTPVAARRRRRRHDLHTCPIRRRLAAGASLSVCLSADGPG